jgi:hypothetical protein
MPEIIPCPRCGRKIRITDELLGKKIKCPSCAVTFVTERAGYEAPESAVATSPGRSHGVARDRHDEDDDVGPRRRRLPPPLNTAAWERVRRGIGLMLIGFFVLLGGMLVVFAAALLAGALSAVVGIATRDASATLGTSVAAVIVVLSIAVVVGLSYVVLRLIGHYFCTAAIDRAGARSLAVWGLWMYIGSLVLPLLLGLVFVCAGVALTSQANAGPGPPAGAGLAAVVLGGALIVYYVVEPALVVGGGFVFLFFLRACAKLVHAPRLALSILFLIAAAALVSVMGLALAGLQLLTTGAVLGAGVQAGSRAGPSPMETAAGVLGVVQAGCGCSMLVLGVAVVIWTIVSMFLVRAAITRYVEGRA